jgi:hypothetical protein
MAAKDFLKRCHPEPVEGYGVKAIPACFDEAQHATLLLFSNNSL